jgi:type VI secretion system protein ImpH
MREFLAAFEHRFYSLFWRAWKKYRLDLALDRVGEQRRTRFLVGVAGFSLPTLAESPAIEPLRLAGFAGLVGLVRTSAAGLRNLVAGYFGGLPVQVLEFVPRRVFVPNRAGLGGDGGLGSARLSDTALVGDTVLDRAAMVRIVIGALPLAHYHALLPGGEWSRALAELARLALPAEFEFQVQLRLKHDEVPPCRLGDSDARLGWLSWIGRPAGDGESAPMSAAAFAAA